VGGGKKKEEKPELVHLGFRGSQELTGRIDALRTFMGEHLGGMNISRSQVLEVLVHRALPLIEAEYIYQTSGGPNYSREEIVRLVRLVAKEEERVRKLREQLPKDK